MASLTVEQLVDEEWVPLRYKGDGAACVMMLVPDIIKPIVYEAADEGIARTFEALDYTNILAMGCDLVVLDPTLLSEDEWNSLHEFCSSFVNIEFRMLLVKPSPFEAVIPSRNLIDAPKELTVEFLREHMRRAGVTPRSKKVWEKKERQIVRLMYMLHCLDTSRLRLRDVAEHFDISIRTVQRDLEVLLMADYIIIEDNEPGVYKFPNGYKSHMAYYGC